MRALITGAGGGLGGALATILPDPICCSRQELDITDEVWVRATLLDTRPEVVFNCAAYDAVDAAETSVEEARAVNLVGPALLARACAEVGAHLVHFSTNYVFDGGALEPYSEEQEPMPRSQYGHSKRGGELAVLAALPQALVVRSAGLFGLTGSAVKGGGFPQRILARARAGETLRVVSDQRLNPTYTADLADGVVGLVAQGRSGLIHLVAAGCCSWLEFARQVLEVAGETAQVEAVSTAELGAAAPRPANGCLRSLRVPYLRPWQEGLRAWWADQEGSPA